MKDTFSREKISAIIDHIKKNPFLNLDQSLSLSYPEVKSAYLKKKIFELKQQISVETYLGRDWVQNGSVNVVDSDWLQRCMVNLYKKETEIVAWEGLELFLRKYFQLIVYEMIVKENESINKSKSDTKLTNL